MANASSWSMGEGIGGMGVRPLGRGNKKGTRDDGCLDEGAVEVLSASCLRRDFAAQLLECPIEGRSSTHHSTLVVIWI